jgi:GTP-binding protein
MNLYLLNNVLYLVDLPGYGHAKTSWKERDRIQTMISWYLLESHYKQKKVILIIDAKVGPTQRDLEVLRKLEEHDKEILVVANKIDKIKRSEYVQQIKSIEATLGRPVLPYSAQERIGVGALVDEILG